MMMMFSCIQYRFSAHLKLGGSTRQTPVTGTDAKLARPTPIGEEQTASTFIIAIYQVEGCDEGHVLSLA